MSTRIDDTQLWQLWRPFVGIHRWFFMRGCPPTIRKLQGWTRVVHASVLMGGLGLLAGLVCVVALGMAGVATDVLSEWGQLAVTGGLVGFILLLPLARWCGRAWWFALLGIVWQAVLLPLIAETSDSLYLPYSRALSDAWGGLTYEAILWGLINVTWSLGMSAWMVDVRRLRSFWLLVWPLPIGICSSCLFALIERYQIFQMLLQTPLANAWGIQFFLTHQAMYYPLQLLFLLQAIVLGSRLWSGSSQAEGQTRLHAELADPAEITEHAA